MKQIEQSGGDSQWRVCYQLGLPCLVSLVFMAAMFPGQFQHMATLSPGLCECLPVMSPGQCQPMANITPGLYEPLATLSPVPRDEPCSVTCPVPTPS